MMYWSKRIFCTPAPLNPQTWLVRKWWIMFYNSRSDRSAPNHRFILMRLFKFRYSNVSIVDHGEIFTGSVISIFSAWCFFCCQWKPKRQPNKPLKFKRRRIDSVCVSSSSFFLLYLMMYINTRLYRLTEFAPSDAQLQLAVFVRSG